MAGIYNGNQYCEGIDITTTTANYPPTGSIANKLNTDGYLYFGNSAGQPQAGLPTSINDTIFYHGSNGGGRFENKRWLSKFVVDPSSSEGERGTYTTIQSAIDAASSGEIIYIRPGTYTEDLTLKPGVALIGNSNSRENPIVNISGSHTASSDGAYTFYGIGFQTNGGTIFTNTSSSGTLILTNCRMDLNDGDGFLINGANAGLIATFCTIIQNVDNAQYFVITNSAANRNSFRSCSFVVNGSLAITDSTIAAGGAVFEYCFFQRQGFVSSGGATMRFMFCYFNGNGNFTYVTTGGTSALNEMVHCHLNSGSSSAVVVGAGTTLRAAHVTVVSSSGSPISVAGTLNTTYTTY